METLLDISETVFFFLASVVLLMFGIMTIVFAYYIRKSAKFLEKIPEELKKARQEFLAKISIAQFIAWIFKKIKNNKNI